MDALAEHRLARLAAAAKILREMWHNRNETGPAIMSDIERREEADDFDSPLDPCWNCDGEGFVYNCFEEYACIDPEGGCDLCMRRCDVCRPRPAIEAALRSHGGEGEG